MKRIKYLFSVLTTMLFLSGLVFPQSTYTQFGNLNFDQVTLTSEWTRLGIGPARIFTKKSDDTQIEVYVNSRFSVGTLSGTNGVLFQVRVDGNTPDFDNMGSILTSSTSSFLAIFAVFQNLGAGNHEVSIYGRAVPSGSVTSVFVDPGGWEGRIIVKETP